MFVGILCGIRREKRKSGRGALQHDRRKRDVESTVCSEHPH